MADTGNTTIITEESQQDPTSQVSQYTDTIDDLLKEYLGLLEQYSNEQARLQSGQQQVYLHIARARFAGQSVSSKDYDQRMKASRRCRTLSKQNGSIQNPATEHIVESIVPPKTTHTNATNKNSAPDVDPEVAGTEKESTEPDHEGGEKESIEKVVDPLHWFGAFASQPLKQAQIVAIQAVEENIPKLINVSARIGAVEIEIRRAKKHRQKLQSKVEKMNERL